MGDERIRLIAQDIKALGTEEAIKIWNTYLCGYLFYNEADIIYDMNELEDILYGLTTKQLLMALDGHYFVTHENYFYFNIMGDLCSISEEELDDVWSFEEMIAETEKMENIKFENVESVKLFLENYR